MSPAVTATNRTRASATWSAGSGRTSARDDAAPDADGDGRPSTCDCDDARGDVHDGATEACDGVDSDCDGHGDLQRLAGARGTELLGRIAAHRATDPSAAPAYGVDDGLALVLPARATADAVVYREPLGAVRLGDDPVELAVDLAPAAVGSDELAVFLSDGARALGVAIARRAPTSGGAARPHADVVYAADAGARIVRDGGAARVDRYVEGRATIRFVLATAGDGAASMSVELGDGATSLSDSYVVPAGSGLDLDKPLSLLVVAPTAAATYGLAEVRASQSLADDDRDGVCDALDRCEGHDDLQDGDGDGTPDACDVCLGPDGLVDLDGDGYPSGCDCDDTTAAVSPGARDVCNGVDDDCDLVADRHTALRLRGAELASHLASGRATGGARALVARAGGEAVEVTPLAAPTPDLDVYYREALSVLPGGAAVPFRVEVDRDPRTGDHDFIIALSDGAHLYGIGLYDVDGSGARYAVSPVAGVDQGASVTATVGAGLELAEASPYTLDVVFGADAHIDVTNAAGETVTVRGAVAPDGGRVQTGALALVLVGQQPTERYLIRAIDVTQALPDDDGDLVCDAIDYCPGEDDLGVDSDGDGIVDPCDVCGLGDDRVDGDGDGVPDACDACDGSDDRQDADVDGVPDGCDACPSDPTNDHDRDGICGRADRCLAGDDRIDGDSDGVPDACDPCPEDATGDSDEDGVCDGADVCLGDDRTGDRDGDGLCGDRDCDDTRAHIHPGAAEICDGFDSDCDGHLGPGELDVDGDGVIDCLGPSAPITPAVDDDGAEDAPRASAPSVDGGCTGGATPGLGLSLLAALAVLARRLRARG